MQVTFNPLSADERLKVEELLASFDADTSTEAKEDAEEHTLSEFLVNAGEQSRRFIELAVKHFAPDQEFTFEQLSAASGIDVSELKAWHRNLSRTARALGGTLPEIIPGRWDGQMFYRIPPKLHTEAGK